MSSRPASSTFELATVASAEAEALLHTPGESPRERQRATSELCELLFREVAQLGKQLPQLSLSDLAERVLELQRRIVREEFGVVSLDVSSSQLLHDLCAREWEARRWQQLTAWSRAVLADTPALELPAYYLSQQHVIDDLRQTVEWYAQRRAVLHAMEQVEEYAEEEGIFNLEVMHDVPGQGVLGAELHCAMRLYGRAGERLWLAVSCERAGRPVEVARGWEGWANKRGAFEVLTPLVIERERVVLDRVAVFLPYGALQLAASSDVELVVTLWSEEGNTLLQARIPTSMRGEPHSLVIPSPQQSELWGVDPVRGSGIEQVRLRRERRGLLLELDIVLAGNAGSSARLDCYVLDQHGDPVPRRAGAQTAPVPHQLSTTLRTERELERISGMEIYLPWHELSLERLPSDVHALLLEVVVSEEDGTVLCGTTVAVDISSDDLLLEDGRAAERYSPQEMFPRVQGHSGIRALRVEPHGSFNGASVVRVHAELYSDAATALPHEVQVVLEAPDGQPLTSHYPLPLDRKPHEPLVHRFSVLLGGTYTSYQLRHVIDVREVLSRLEPETMHLLSEGAAEVVARLRLVSRRGELLSEAMQPFRLLLQRVRLSEQRQHRTPPIYIEDLEVRQLSPLSRQCAVTLQSLSSQMSAASHRLVYEVFEPAKRVVVNAGAPQRALLHKGEVSFGDGATSPFLLASLPRDAWVQSRASFELPSQLAGVLRVSLVDAQGECSQSVHFDLRDVEVAPSLPLLGEAARSERASEPASAMRSFFSSSFAFIGSLFGLSALFGRR